MNLHTAKKFHLIGIKGQGMTALAEVLSVQGARVTGSDTPEVFTTDAILKKRGISFAETFDPMNIPKDTEVIVYSTAYTRDKNSELEAAYSLSVPVLSYPEALGFLTREKMTLAVCGTHGKTTTSALLADTMRHAGLDPSAIIGSQIHAWGGNALAGAGQYLVLEADEYQNKLQFYEPFGVVLTSLDWDHPDFFETPAEYEKVFVDFLARVPRHGFIVACGDSALVKKVAEDGKRGPLLYGFHPDNAFHITEYEPIHPETQEGKAGFLQSFVVEHAGESLGRFQLKLSGRHNALNATAVLAVASVLKLPIEKVREAFSVFSGTKRRFEKVGEYHGAFVYDDYAHHPEEVRATLSAFRDLYPERALRVVFHPHTFTRTKALLQEFAQCFDAADEVNILEIYGSARESQGGVSSQDLVNLINRYTPGKATFISDKEELIATLKKELGAAEVLVTMGAGDVWQIGQAIIH